MDDKDKEDRIDRIITRIIVGFVLTGSIATVVLIALGYWVPS